MMEEKRKRGRPRKSEKTNNEFGKDSFQQESNSYSFNNNDKMNSESINSDIDLDEATLKDMEELDNQSDVNDIPSEDFNPLNEAITNRSYTKGITNSTNSQERIIEEPNYFQSSGASKIEVDNNLINPQNNINNSTNDIPNSNQNINNSINNENSINSDKGDNLKKLSPKEEREVYEKTAEMFLMAYKAYLPIPFNYLGKFSEKKLNKLHEDNEIDLDAQIKRDGTTFREYYKDFNSKVEKINEVSDEEVELIKDPLIDVLMERDVKMTPTQRLIFAIGQSLVNRTMATITLSSEKKKDIEEMKQIHRERMEIREQSMQKKNREEKIKRQTESINRENIENEEKIKQEIKKQKEEEIIEDADNDYGDEEPNLDNALNFESTEIEEGNNDIP